MFLKKSFGFRKIIYIKIPTKAVVCMSNFTTDKSIVG